VPTLNLPPPDFLAFLSNAFYPVPECLSNGCGSAGTPFYFLDSFDGSCNSFFFITYPPEVTLEVPLLAGSSSFFF